MLATFLFAEVAIICYQHLKENLSGRKAGTKERGNMEAEAKRHTAIVLNHNSDCFTCAASDPTTGKMDTIGTIVVPRHTKLYLRPEDTFYFTGKDTESTPAALADTTPIRVIKQDTTGDSSETLFEGLYGEMKTLGDNTKQFKIGQYAEIPDGFKIVIQGEGQGSKTIDASAATFALRCMRETPKM